MRSSFKLTEIFGIDIKVHVTFFLLLGLFFLVMGIRGLLLVAGVFLFVTLHELAHSLTAMHFGVTVSKITLLPIGGVASMSRMPTKPSHELLISLAGPLSNVLIVIIFFLPLRGLLGADTLMHPLRILIGQIEYAGPGSINLLAHIYWINLVLAGFNLLPAFPMDGGRVLRAILSFRKSRKDATRIAVRMGHIFAIFFGYFGIVDGNIMLLIIAVFIYMAASSEGMQVSFSETLKNYTVSDILDLEFVEVDPDAPLGRVIELMLHKHQENIPVTEEGEYRVLLTLKEFIKGMHDYNENIACGDLMRKDLPVTNGNSDLGRVHRIMQENETPALAVEKNGKVSGVITSEDISRLHIVLNAQEGKPQW